MSGKGLQIGAVLDRLHAAALEVRGGLAGEAALDAATAEACVDALLAAVERELPDVAMMPLALLAGEYPAGAVARASELGVTPEASGQEIVDALLVGFLNQAAESQGFAQRLEVRDLQ